MQRFTICISTLMSLMTGVSRSQAVDIRQPSVQTTHSSPYYGGETYGVNSSYVSHLYGTNGAYPSQPIRYQPAIPTTTNYPPVVAPTRQYLGQVQPFRHNKWTPTYPVQTPIYHAPVRTRVPSYTWPIQNRVCPGVPVAPFRCDPYTGCRGY